MKPKLMIGVVLIGAMALISCSDTPATIDEIPTTLPEADDLQDMVADVQTEIEDIATELENSDANAELQSAWAEIETEIRSAVDSVAQEGTIDTSGMQDQMDEFQETLTALGDDVSDELESSWAALRSALDQLMS
jgi:chromosome segregation ATPase